VRELVTRDHRPRTTLERAALRALALLAWLPLACAGPTTNNYAVAGVALGGTVIAAGANRAITGDCWAHCAPGYVCDRPRGLCVKAECAPGCPVGTHCEREADGRFSCIDDVGAFTLGPGPRATSPSFALVDAGAPDPVDAGAASGSDAGTPSGSGDAGAGPNPR